VSESMFIRLFAGVPSDYFGAIPLIPFGWWLLSMGVFLLAVGFYGERDRKLEVLFLYRCKTVKGWWKRRFGKGLLYGIKTAVLFLVLVLSWDIAVGSIVVLSAELFAKITILWLFHSVSMAALFVLLDLFPVGRFAPGALFLLEGVTFIIGCQVHAVSKVMYGMWGMYLQSGLCEAGGFPVGPVIAAEAVLPAAGFWIGWEYLKRERDLV
jgi:hypothetical protein